MVDSFMSEELEKFSIHPADAGRVAGGTCIK
jgi:hypothetical protein